MKVSRWKKICLNLSKVAIQNNNNNNNNNKRKWNDQKSNSENNVRILSFLELNIGVFSFKN